MGLDSWIYKKIRLSDEDLKKISDGKMTFTEIYNFIEKEKKKDLDKISITIFPEGTTDYKKSEDQELMLMKQDKFVDLKDEINSMRLPCEEKQIDRIAREASGEKKAKIRVMEEIYYFRQNHVLSDKLESAIWEERGETIENCEMCQCTEKMIQEIEKAIEEDDETGAVKIDPKDKELENIYYYEWY